MRTDSIHNLLVNKLLLPNTAYITNDYDSNARLLDTWLRNSGNTNLNVHSYAYNVGNQRTNQTFLKGNFQGYSYNNIGQLTNVVGKDDAGGVTNRLQEQLTYRLRCRSQFEQPDEQRLGGNLQSERLERINNNRAERDQRTDCSRDNIFQRH